MKSRIVKCTYYCDIAKDNVTYYEVHYWKKSWFRWKWVPSSRTRCGPGGKPVTESRKFNTVDEAEKFIESTVDGRCATTKVVVRGE